MCLHLAVWIFNPTGYNWPSVTLGWLIKLHLQYLVILNLYIVEMQNSHSYPPPAAVCSYYLLNLNDAAPIINAFSFGMAIQT